MNIVRSVNTMNIESFSRQGHSWWTTAYSFVDRCFLMTRFFFSSGSDMAIFCLLCGKRFQTQTALQQHMEVHAGVRSYICSECNRTFPSHTALKRHLRSHTGQWNRPVSCSALTSPAWVTVFRRNVLQMWGFKVLACTRRPDGSMDDCLRLTSNK